MMLLTESEEELQKLVVCFRGLEKTFKGKCWERQSDGCGKGRGVTV